MEVADANASAAPNNDLLSPCKRLRSSFSESMLHKRKEASPVNVSESLETEVPDETDNTVCINRQAMQTLQTVQAAPTGQIRALNKEDIGKWDEMRHVDQQMHHTHAMRSSFLTPSSAFSPYSSHSLDILDTPDAYNTITAPEPLQVPVEPETNVSVNDMTYSVFTAPSTIRFNSSAASDSVASTCCTTGSMLTGNSSSPVEGLLCTDTVGTLSSDGMFGSDSSSGTLNSIDVPVRPTWNEQKRLIEPLLAMPIVDGEVYYMVSASWMKAFYTYLQEGPPRTIGPVDQTPMMSQNRLKFGLVKGKDYEFVSRMVWQYLSLWFGVKGHAFPRAMASLSMESAISSSTMNTDADSYVFRLVQMKIDSVDDSLNDEVVNDETEDGATSDPPSPIVVAAGNFSESAAIIGDAETVENDHNENKVVDNSSSQVVVTQMGINEERVADLLDDVPELASVSSFSSTKVITSVDSLTTPSVNPLHIHLTINGSQTVSSLLHAVRQALAIAPMQPIRLWHERRLIATSWELLPSETTVKSLGLPLDAEICVEITDRTSLTSSTSSASAPLLGMFSNMYDKKQTNSDHSTFLGIQMPVPSSKLTAIGLQNLGNSCYMNAALQCLTHTSELTTYFLSGVYRWEVNLTNPLGTGGQIARSYAALLNSLAHTTIPSFSPKAFKNCIGRFNPSFAGHAQQDSQELLAFLLDGMHEDLNRIQKKPYFEKPTLCDTDDALIAETADICWQLHRKRNDSVIVDLFHGLYKSVLVCPVCDQVSITFDPFMDLTLPLPFKNQWTYPVTVVPSDIKKKQIQITVELDASSTIASLKAYVASKLGMDVHALISSEIYAYKFYKHHSDASIVSSHLSPHDEVYLYEMPSPISDFATNRNKILIPVFHQRIEKPYNHAIAFGIPFFILLTPQEACSYNIIAKKIAEKYKQFIGLKEACQDQVQQTAQQDNDTSITIDFYQESIKNELKKENDFNENFFDLKYFSSRHSILPTGWSVPMDHLPKLKIRLGKNIDSDKSLDEDALMTAESEEEPFSHGTPISLDDMVDDSDFSITKDSSDDELLPANPISEKASQTSSKQDHQQRLFSESNNHENKISKNNKAYIHQGEAIVCEWSSDQYACVFSDKTKNGLRSSTVWDDVEKYEDPLLSSNREKSIVYLDDCLDLFSKKEQLGEDDLWYCPNCKEHRRATKQLEIWKSPDIFVIHLKRFSNSRNLRDKIDILVNFPLKGLDLSQRVAGCKYGSSLANDSQIYDLYAVSNHFGGLGGGHYTAYVALEDGHFYHFDDSLVMKVHESQIVTPAAYLLFYRRRTDKVLGESTMAKITEYLSKISTEPCDKINVTSSLNKVSDLTMSDEKFILDPHTISMPNMPSNMTHVDLFIRTPDDSINSNSQDTIESEKITYSDGFDYNDKDNAQTLESLT